MKKKTKQDFQELLKTEHCEDIIYLLSYTYLCVRCEVFLGCVGIHFLLQ